MKAVSSVNVFIYRPLCHTVESSRAAAMENRLTKAQLNKNFEMKRHIKFYGTACQLM